MKKHGMIIIVSAPSGAGKTSICDAVIKDDKNVIYSVSTTTRIPRKGEKDGREYFFTDQNQFKKSVAAGKFAEWARVHDNYYGTSKDTLTKALKRGKDVLLDIDVQGALQIKKQYKDALMIFIMTPTLGELRKRLVKRNKDSVETINKRIENAKKEIKYADRYDYLVLNDKLDKSIAAVKSIITAERLSVKRNKVIF